MFIDASIGVSLKEKGDDEVKTLITNICQNEYHSSERVVKGKGVLEVDIQTVLLAQMEDLTKELDRSQLTQSNVS